MVLCLQIEIGPLRTVNIELREKDYFFWSLQNKWYFSHDRSEIDIGSFLRDEGGAERDKREGILKRRGNISLGYLQNRGFILIKIVLTRGVLVINKGG